MSPAPHPLLGPFSSLPVHWEQLQGRDELLEASKPPKPGPTPGLRDGSRALLGWSRDKPLVLENQDPALAERLLPFHSQIQTLWDEPAPFGKGPVCDGPCRSSLSLTMAQEHPITAASAVPLPNCFPPSAPPKPVPQDRRTPCRVGPSPASNGATAAPCMWLGKSEGIGMEGGMEGLEGQHPSPSMTKQPARLMGVCWTLFIRISPRFSTWFPTASS